VRDGRVSAAIRIRPETRRIASPPARRAEAALRALPGVAQALVVLTADTPAPPAPQPPKHPQPARPPARAAGVAHVIAVASGKGGVGKSTTAVNLALGLRALGLTVGILDADIYGPSLPTLLGLRGKPRMGADRKLLPMEAFGLKAMSMGLLVDAETAMVWRGPMVMSAITQMLAEVDWGRSTCCWSTCRPAPATRSWPSRRAPACRRGHRLDPAGPVADRRAPRHHHVPQGRRADPRRGREHGAFPLCTDLRHRATPIFRRAPRAAPPRTPRPATPRPARGVPFLGAGAADDGRRRLRAASPIPAAWQTPSIPPSRPKARASRPGPQPDRQLIA
jgi:hypothetical protein